MDRRQFLASAAALGAAGAFPRMAFAQSAIGIGEGRLRTLSDGHLTLPADFIFGPTPKDHLAEVLAPFGMDPGAPLTPPCNLTLWQEEDRVVLFDAGAGTGFQPSAGQLPAALDAAGIAPEDVTHVVFTHAHPDHFWGVLDDFDDPMFPNAEHMIARSEWAYWTDPTTVAAVGPARAAFAVGASRRLEALEDALSFFNDGEEILPGIAARATPGHTPGHMSFEIRRGGDAAMVIGDASANDHVGLARPDWPLGSDQDPALAARTRVGLLEQIAAGKMAAVGFHFAHGGLGRVEAAGDGFRFVALDA